MHFRKRALSLVLTIALLLSMLVFNVPALAAEDAGGLRPVEYLTRGLVAAKVNAGVFLSWRFLGDEPDGISWNVYRDDGEGFVKIGTIDPGDVAPESSYDTNPGIVKENVTPSSYTDPDGQLTSLYEVAPVTGGVEGPRQGMTVPMLTTSGSGSNLAATLNVPLKTTGFGTYNAPQFDHRGIACGPTQGTLPVIPRTDSTAVSPWLRLGTDNASDYWATRDTIHYVVDMDLLRSVREPHDKGETVTQELIDTAVAKLNNYLTLLERPVMASMAALDGGKITKAFYDAFELKFFEYVNWLDSGPKLSYKKNANGSITTSSLITNTTAYYPIDLTVGDFDGDGEYEVVALMTSGGGSGADPYQNCTGVGGNSIVAPCFVDVYKLDGTLLFRVDCGPNVMLNNHHQPMMYVQDFDGDGKSELMMKLANGAQIGNWNGTAVVYSGDPDTVVGGAEGLKSTRDAINNYAADGDTESLDKYWNQINGWSISYYTPDRTTAEISRANTVNKRWIKTYHVGYNGGNVPETFSAFKYDVEAGKGVLLDSAPYPFPYDNVNDPNYNKFRDQPDFNGQHWGVAPMDPRGAYAYASTDSSPTWRTFLRPLMDPNETYWLENPWGYYPWGDPQGNRSSRHMGATASLDGENWYAVSGRGYYHRTTFAAANIVDGKVNIMACFDSADEQYWSLGGDWYDYQNRGNHQMMSADVDGDGRDELVMSAMTLKLNDAKDKILPINVAGGNMPAISDYPADSGPTGGTTLIDTATGKSKWADNTWYPLRHGDRSQMMAADKTNRIVYWSSREENFVEDLRTGLVHAAMPSATVHDPATGEIIQGVYATGGNDWDSGTAGNFTNRWPGALGQTPSGGSINLSTGEIADVATYGVLVQVGSGTPIWWDGDLVQENINTATVTKLGFNQTGTTASWSNAYTGSGSGSQKGTPMLKVDLFGDWREEFINRSGNNLVIHTTVSPTEYGIRTLMHDPMYRQGVANMHISYNQGGNASFYLGDEAELPSMRSDIYIPNPFLSTVTFDYNGGEGSVESKEVYLGQAYGELPEAVREDYVFIGWSTDGTLKGKVTAETVVKIAGDHTLKALWGTDVSKAYTITYNGNEATTGTPPVDTMNYLPGAVGKVLGQGSLSREDYLFIGWNTEADGSGTAYNVGDWISVKLDVTLYAQWEFPDDGKIRVSLSGKSAVTINDVAEYVLSAANMEKLATVTLWFEVDGTYFSGKDIEGLNGFSVLGDIVWESKDGSLYSGRVTLANMSGGVTGKAYMELFKLTLAVKEELGGTEVKLARISMSGYNEDGKAVYFESIVKNGKVETEVVAYFSPYDVNRDGKIDQLDLTTAQLYYAAREGDPNWDEAKAADVNGDGRVDIEDLILILSHIDW